MELDHLSKPCPIVQLSDAKAIVFSSLHDNEQTFANLNTIVQLPDAKARAFYSLPQNERRIENLDRIALHNTLDKFVLEAALTSAIKQKLITNTKAKKYSPVISKIVIAKLPTSLRPSLTALTLNLLYT